MIQILTHVFRAITLVVLMLGIGLTGADAVARELAIVMEPADSWDVDRFRTDLGGMGFTLGPAVIKSDLLSVFTAEGPLLADTTQIYGGIDFAAAHPNCLQAGELIANDAAQVTLYGGEVLVQFAVRLTDEDARCPSPA